MDPFFIRTCRFVHIGEGRPTTKHLDRGRFVGYCRRFDGKTPQRTTSTSKKTQFVFLAPRKLRGFISILYGIAPSHLLASF